MFSDKRDCIELDMRCADADYSRVLNKYSMFEPLYIQHFAELKQSEENITKFIEELRKEYYIDDDLIMLYLKTLNMKLKLIRMDIKLVTNVKMPYEVDACEILKGGDNDGTED